MTGPLLHHGGREWELPQLYADDDILLVESEQELDRMVGRFDGMCRRILKVNVIKSKVLVS